MPGIDKLAQATLQGQGLGGVRIVAIERGTRGRTGRQPHFLPLLEGAP